jgi:FMN phosphatase YigB (HAD superfamily)
VFLDDHEPNVAAARACGWQAQHFTTAAQAAVGLQRAGVQC